MNKREIDEAQKVIDTPDTTENLHPLVPTFPSGKPDPSDAPDAPTGKDKKYDGPQPEPINEAIWNNTDL